MALDPDCDADGVPEPTPRDVLREVAAILARGLIRLRERDARTAGEESPKTLQKPLEDSARSWPSVHAG